MTPDVVDSVEGTFILVALLLGTLVVHNQPSTAGAQLPVRERTLVFLMTHNDSNILSDLMTFSSSPDND